MRKSILIALIFTAVGWAANTAWQMTKALQNPTSRVNLAGRTAKPLEKYTIENLSKTEFKASEIKIEGEHLFSFTVDGKKVTGCINLPAQAGIPNEEGPFPVIVMFRGYVDQKNYQTCDGTRRVGEYFAKNGFITLAPDFLGYGGSDKEAGNIFEARFQTYTTALTLLKSLDHSITQPFNFSSVGIWGHSNGGQIALTVLEVTGKDYPTVLWAPVSKPFPYSILYYTDESDDHGKFIRKELAQFEENYDVDKYSLTNYLDKIKAPISLHQGTADDAVPLTWSNELAKKLLDLNLDLDYFKYPGADHNLQPAWNLAVSRSLDFFRQNLLQ